MEGDIPADPGILFLVLLQDRYNVFPCPHHRGVSKTMEKGMAVILTSSLNTNAFRFIPSDPLGSCVLHYLWCSLSWQDTESSLQLLCPKGLDFHKGKGGDNINGVMALLQFLLVRGSFVLDTCHWMLACNVIGIVVEFGWNLSV